MTSSSAAMSDSPMAAPLRESALCSLSGSGVASSAPMVNRSRWMVWRSPSENFGGFYAGMRGASCRLIDNLDQVGGQLTALYPEKYIFDVAGFPKVLSKDLVKGMAEQAFQFKQPVHLGENVTGLKRDSENGKPAFTVVTDKDEYPSRTVLIAGGIGAFTPRRLPLKEVDRWYGK